MAAIKVSVIEDMKWVEKPSADEFIAELVRRYGVPHYSLSLYQAPGVLFYSIVHRKVYMIIKKNNIYRLAFFHTAVTRENLMQLFSEVTCIG